MGVWVRKEKPCRSVHWGVWGFSMWGGGVFGGCQWDREGLWGVYI